MLTNQLKQLTFVLIATVLCLNFAPASSQSFTPSEMETILKVIDTYFFLPFPTYKIEIRKFLRGAFHDCMGGCDGSINLLMTDNRGLESYTHAITAAYNASIKSTNPSYSLFQRMSRADFWVLCEQRALAWGIKNGNITFNYSGVVYVHGRPALEVYNHDLSQPELPNAAGSWSDMLKVVKNGIKILLQQDIVALLGLHGPGTADIYNSGFQGPWGPAEDKNIINNHFFISLLNYGYPLGMLSQVAAINSTFPNVFNPNINRTSPPPPTDLIEWVHSSGKTIAQMMLPIDMQIYLKFTPNATGGQSSGDYCSQGNNQTIFDCTVKNNQTKKYLPLASNAPLALKFAKSNADFISALIAAFLKMVSYTGQNVTLTPFIPQWGCVNGTTKCLGDVLFGGCSPPSIQC